MSGSILIADANRGFAGMLQQAIVEAGFSCQTAASVREAINLASSAQVSLAIIDLDLPDAVPSAFIAELRRASPGIILLGIPPDDEAKARELPTLGLQGTLTKPFYMPDFIPQLKTLLSEPPPALKEASTPGLLAAEEKLLEMLGIGGAETPLPPGSPAPAHAEAESHARELDFVDATHAAAILARLTAGTATRASLLTREGKLFAFEGELSADHATQAARLVAGGWNRHERGVWLRYMRLQGTEEDLLLYSTPASGRYVLALVFPSPTPIREARSLTHTVLEGLYHGGAAEVEEAQMLAPARAGKTAVLRPRPKADEPVQAVAVPSKTRRLDARKAPPAAKERAPAAPPVATSAPSSAAPRAAAAPKAPARPAAEGKPATAADVAGIRLNYNIVLTPADPAHRLLPEIASDLEGYVRTQIAKHGWRAQRITVRPDHCLISLSAPASSPPSDIIRVLRSETSAHILARLAPAGGAPAAGEYWTATHLLTTQEQPPTPGQIANFIAQTRKSQHPPSTPAATG
jgi:DNA-binding response OmpR family regulator/REP element-mobilizing transposase RayT